MAEESEDKDSKTEEPSQKKLEDAIEKGQVANSREVTSFLMLLALTIITTFILPFSAKLVSYDLRSILEHAGDVDITSPTLSKILYETSSKILLYLVPIFLFIILIIISSSFFQHGQFIFAPDQITPKASRISIFEGFGRLFSFKSVAEFLKGIFKITVTGLIIYVVVMDDIKIMSLYPLMTESEIINELFKVIKDILISITLLMFVISVADFFYQKYEYFKNMMMSRQELKDEYKQTEGSPEIKSKQRQLMQQASKKRMMANVPKADVIITNPEHYSIALKYSYQEMSAPIIVAKGLDLVAMKIREIAKEHDIPIVENPPLARALFLVELDKPIPVEHYETVAEIISYVFKLKKKTI